MTPDELQSRLAEVRALDARASAAFKEAVNTRYRLVAELRAAGWSHAQVAAGLGARAVAAGAREFVAA